MIALQHKTTLHILRILIGLVFITSAIFKLIGIDAFEVYMFSLQWFNLPVASVIARLIISVEFIIGIFFITNIQFKLISKITFGLLIYFCIFLIIQILSGNKENCHCFGEIIQLNPTSSLIKNLLLLFILFLIRRDSGYNIKYSSSIALFVLVFAIAFPMLYSPPYFAVKWPQMPTSTLEIAAKRAQNNQLLQTQQAASGKKIICFLSVSCSYCVNGANKMAIIAENNQLNDEILFVFTGDEMLLPEFLEKSNAPRFNYVFLPMRDFFSIAGPSIPSIYLSDNGKFIHQFNYKNIDEATIISFLQQ